MSIRSLVNCVMFGGLAATAVSVVVLLLVMTAFRIPPKTTDAPDWYDWMIEALFRSILWFDAFLVGSGLWILART